MRRASRWCERAVRRAIRCVGGWAVYLCRGEQCQLRLFARGISTNVD